MNVVENGCKVVNVDNSELRKLKGSVNAFDVGMERILEALDLFIDDMEATFYYEEKVPYEKLFNALKSIIRSAKESENIRNACVTGVISDVPSQKTVKKHTGGKKINKVINKREVALDKKEVEEYAEGRTLQEIAEHFGLSKLQAKNYIVYHNITYKKDHSGRKSSLDIEKVKSLARSMTISEIARTFMVSRDCVYKCCQRHKIVCRKKGDLI